MLHECERCEVENAAVNILAVEHLVKENNYEEYSRKIDIFRSLSDDELSDLYFSLSLNMHIHNLGCMITQGDYEYQKEILFLFLDGRK